MFHKHEFDGIRENISEYQQLCEKYHDQTLQESKVLEIGFGQRPIRFYTMASLGVDVKGVDIEQPTLGIRDLNRVLMRNG